MEPAKKITAEQKANCLDTAKWYAGMVNENLKLADRYEGTKSEPIEVVGIVSCGKFGYHVIMSDQDHNMAVYRCNCGHVDAYADEPICEEC